MEEEENKTAESPLDIQVGGEHYNSKFQPIELMERVRMFPSCANVLKYVFRHKQKNGKQDLEKALHYCAFIKQFGYNWYYGTSLSYSEIDCSKDEFYRFIKENDQLDANQIRAITAMAYRDLETLKDAIHKEISECYS